MLFITASVCVLHDDALLTVRKRGTSAFMLPGGKIEAEESSVRCAVREAEEEIGLSFTESDLALIGDWTAPINCGNYNTKTKSCVGATAE